MARYLSPAWFDELNAAARSATVADALSGLSFTIQQIVTAGPGGDIRYVVRVRDGALTVQPGEDPGADVTVSQDWETAVAVVRGTLAAPAALMTGRMRVSGNLSTLLANQQALTRLDEVFAGVRDTTEF